MTSEESACSYITTVLSRTSVVGGGTAQRKGKKGRHRCSNPALSIHGGGGLRPPGRICAKMLNRDKMGLQVLRVAATVQRFPLVHRPHLCGSSVTHTGKGHASVPKNGTKFIKGEGVNTSSTLPQRAAVTGAVSAAGTLGTAEEHHGTGVPNATPLPLLPIRLSFPPHFARRHLASFTTTTRLSVKRSLSLRFSHSAQKEKWGEGGEG